MDQYLKILESTVKANWDAVALENYRGEQFKFGELASNIEKFHLFFEKAGVAKGDHISICAKNNARWALSFLSINTYGAVAVPILCDFLPDSILHLVNHSESVMLFTDRDIWKKMDQSQLQNVKAVICVNDFTLLYSADQSITSAFETLPDAFDSKYPMGFTRENVSYGVDDEKSVAVINYTSGTTSAPKGVILRYECFSAMVNYAITRVKPGPGLSVVSMLPMGHIYGLSFEFLFPLTFGARICYLGKTPSPTLLLKAMDDVKPFMVVAVPLVMEKVYKSSIKPVISRWYMKVLLHTPLVNRFIYKSIGDKVKLAFGGNVRHFILGGAALNPDVEKCFKRIGLPYTVGYGMTEAAPLLAYEDWKSYVPGSCGKPVACCQLRIDSEDPQHIAGEIQAKGTNICSGYFKNEEASANAFTEDGFFRTGDLGIMDKDGNVFIKGRSKNMILSANGQNIYPEEVEAVINSQSYVSESVVVDRSSKLVALIYLDADAIKRDGLDNETISDIPENIRVSSNRLLPNYSQITKVEVMTAPFEKTPKMSIKRFLYK